jgi:hypothetical protein
MKYFEVCACENLMGLPIVKMQAIVQAKNQKSAINKFQRFFDCYGMDEYRARSVNLIALEFITPNKVKRWFYRDGNKNGYFIYDFIK